MILTNYFEEQIRKANYSRIMEIRRFVEEYEEDFIKTTIKLKTDLVKILLLVEKNVERMTNPTVEVPATEKKEFEDFTK
jgi:hypothetical protein